MADGFGLRQKLDARIASARRSLLWPALTRAVLPALVWFTVFAVFWLTGLYTAMPIEAQATTGVIFWVGFITAGVVLLVAFVVSQTKVAHPLLPLRVVSHRVRAGALLLQAVAGTVMIGAMLYVTLHLQIVLALSPLQAGLAGEVLPGLLPAPEIGQSESRDPALAPGQCDAAGMRALV